MEDSRPRAMDNASWPSHQDIPPAIKDLVKRCYYLLDVAEVYDWCDLFEEIFGPDGEIVVNKRTIKGVPQFYKWIRSCWDPIGRQTHLVDKVYISDGPGDLLMMGTRVMILVTGHTVETPFCARAVVDDLESEKPQLKLWQMWIDDTPFPDSGMIRKTSRPSGVLDTIGGR